MYYRMSCAPVTDLLQIRDIQGVLGIQDPEEREEIANTDAFNGPDIIFGQPQALTHLDFYNILPPRVIVDRLISFYFNAKHLQLRKKVASFFEKCADFFSGDTS